MKTVDVEIDNRIVKIIIEFDETNNEMNYVELCLRMDIPNTNYTMVKKLDSYNVEFDYDGNYTEQSRKKQTRKICSIFDQLFSNEKKNKKTAQNKPTNNQKMLFEMRIYI